MLSFKVMNLVELTIKVMISGVGGSSSDGRALAFQAGGREFESRLPLQTSGYLLIGLNHYLW